MSAIPVNSTQAAIMQYGQIGPKLVDNQAFNANSNVEIAQNNIAKNNIAQQQAVQAERQAENDQKRTEVAPKPKPEGNLGHNVDVYA